MAKETQLPKLKRGSANNQRTFTDEIQGTTLVFNVGYGPDGKLTQLICSGSCNTDKDGIRVNAGLTFDSIRFPSDREPDTSNMAIPQAIVDRVKERFAEIKTAVENGQEVDAEDLIIEAPLANPIANRVR